MNLWTVSSSEQFYTDFLILTSENQDDRDAKAKRPGFQFIFQKMLFRRPQSHRTSVWRKESICVFKMRRSCSSQETRAQYAAPRPLLQRLSPTLCTPILRFTDTSVTGAGRSNPWLCFACRRLLQRPGLSDQGSAIPSRANVRKPHCLGGGDMRWRGPLAGKARPATTPGRQASTMRLISQPPPCALRSTPYVFLRAGSSLSQSCPKNGDVPKFPFPTVAAVAPSAGTITL
jgi:hypothetical protein